MEILQIPAVLKGPLCFYFSPETDVTERETEEEEECVNSGEDTGNNESGHLEDSDLDEMAWKCEKLSNGDKLAR